MKLLFPSDPIKRFRVDPDFAVELEAARDVGFESALYSLESLEQDEVDDALKGFVAPEKPEESILHRGWMMTGERYRQLHDGLSSRGHRVAVSPEGYEEAHYLPLAIRHFESDTARSEWIEGDEVESAWQLYQGFSGEKAIIKDWVKSAKHRWAEACLIPAGTDRERFGEVFLNFRRERGDKFNRGVVIREHLPLAERGSDIRGFPIVEEHRLFFWKGTLVAAPETDSGESPVDELERWAAIARRFQNPFITIDVARLQDGGWVVIEAGDGGVSGLPLAIDPFRFFASLWNRIAENP